MSPPYYGSTPLSSGGRNNQLRKVDIQGSVGWLLLMVKYVFGFPPISWHTTCKILGTSKVMCQSYANERTDAWGLLGSFRMGLVARGMRG
jgi:hypothetical protein